MPISFVRKEGNTDPGSSSKAAIQTSSSEKSYLSMDKETGPRQTCKTCIPVPVLRAYEVASAVSSPSWRPVWDFGVVSQLSQMYPGDRDQPRELAQHVVFVTRLAQSPRQYKQSYFLFALYFSWQNTFSCSLSDCILHIPRGRQSPFCPQKKKWGVQAIAS